MEHTGPWDKGLFVTKWHGKFKTAITVKYRKGLPWKVVEPLVQNALLTLDQLMSDAARGE